MTSARQGRLGSERGAALVLFAIVLPVILAFGSAVITVGNWWVHKRHLQTQVDAAAFAAGTRFIGCFFDQGIANGAIKQTALEYAGDTNRVPSPATTFNLQEQQPGDVHVVLNSASYWAGGATDDATLSTTLDNTITYAGDPDPPPGDRNEPCETKFLDVKATDDEAPTLWGWLPFVASPKTHAKVAIHTAHALEGLLPFAVPEFDPGAVVAIFVNEQNGQVIGTPVKLNDVPSPDPGISKYNVFTGLFSMRFEGGIHDAGVHILVSAADTPNPDLSGNSLATICGRPKVRCYASNGQGLALAHGYETGGSAMLRRVDVSGCDGTPYFTLIEACAVVVSAEIEFGATPNPQVRLHDDSGCSGNSTPMSQGSGNTWTAPATLPEESANVGQAPFSIAYKSGPGPWQCFPDSDVVARPYIANGKSGPVEFLALQAYDKDAVLLPNGYSVPNDPVLQPITFSITVGLRPPLYQSSLMDDPVLLRFASDDDPSLTQSIDCDDDNYQYPPPFDTMPKDAAEIGHGCVTPYAQPNTTLDCSDYGLGDLPPEPPPVTTWENAPDCARSKQGTVNSLRKGLEARFYPDGECVPNNWPETPTPENILALIETADSDPRIMMLIVTDFGQFGGSGSTIVPVKYIAGFYASGWDVSAQTPACTDNDPHPRYGTGYRQNKDDGDIWGYLITPVAPPSSGSPSDELCNFDELETCIAVLVE